MGKSVGDTDIVICDVESIELFTEFPESATTGPVRVRQLSPELGADFVQVTHVEFDAGVRFVPHSHPSDQIVYYIEGTGVVAVDDGPDVLVPAGSAALLPKNRPHIHGSTEDGPAVHISLISALTATWVET